MAGAEGAPHFRRLAGLATAQTVTILLLYWLVPATRRALVREHGVVEWATALLFLAAVIVGVRRLRAAGVRWRDPRWIIPALSLLALLDEVSWVVFPLGVKAPTVLGKRIDGLHDFIDVAVIGIRDHAPRWSVLVLAIAFAGGLLWVALRAPRWWPALTPPAHWQCFALAVGLGALAQVFDVVFHQNRLAQLFEEVLELDGALAMLFSTTSWSRRAPR